MWLTTSSTVEKAVIPQENDTHIVENAINSVNAFSHQIILVVRHRLVEENEMFDNAEKVFWACV